MARFETLYLLIAGAVALLIGLGMAALPHIFYSSYGIDITASANLANELRSPGLWLALAGLAIGFGVVRPEARAFSLAISAALYLSYAAARAISIVADGVPGTGLMIAMASEILLGVCGAMLWWPRRRSLRVG